MKRPISIVILLDEDTQLWNVWLGDEKIGSADTLEAASLLIEHRICVCPNCRSVDHTTIPDGVYVCKKDRHDWQILVFFNGVYQGSYPTQGAGEAALTKLQKRSVLITLSA